METDFYNVNDYVKYVGDYSTLDPIKRNADFAKILEIQKYDDVWMVIIELLKTKEKVLIDISFIRPLLLEERHLINLGFNKLPNNEDPEYFSKRGIYISSIVITLNNFIYISGFSLVNENIFRDFDIRNYIDKENVFQAKKFRKDFPPLDNLNKLIKLLKSQELISEEDIENLLSKESPEY